MSYTYENLPASSFLRADPHAQKTSIKTSDGIRYLVNKDQFWGNDTNEGLYYDYNNDDNLTGYTYSQEGWNSYKNRPINQMKKEQTNSWIKKHIIQPHKKSLCVIQGYAGCGKTTFVYDLLNKALSTGSYSDYHDMYIGYNSNVNENNLIFTSILSNLIIKITNELKQKDGIRIYKTFINLFRIELSDLNPSLGEIEGAFYSESNTSLYKCALDIYNNTDDKKTNELDVNFRVQFKTLFDTMVKRFHASQNNTIIDNSHNQIYMDILICIDLLWHCAVSIVRNNNNTNHIIVYDNLDIIDNHKIVADFIDTLREIMRNYCAFKENVYQLSEEEKNALPSFKIIITVRKITYGAISRFREVSNSERGQHAPDVDFLDVSNLYPPSNVLKHKSKMLLNNINDYIPDCLTVRPDIEYYLKEISEIPHDLFDEIKISELLNQNIRACSNLLEEVIGSSLYKEHLKLLNQYDLPAQKCCRTAIWICIICTILKENNVWNNLGYNLSSSKALYHPTTLSRMLLTYLSNHRDGYNRGDDRFKSYDVSLKEIVKTFSKIPFCVLPENYNWKKEIIPYMMNDVHEEDTIKLIVDMLSKMLQRNESVETLELWRRPIYYTRNTFPIVDISTTKEYLFNQIPDILNNKNNSTFFCITDEGSTLVEKIVTHFEFSSVRLNEEEAVPLCSVRDTKTIDLLVNRVFKHVNLCATKQIWLMDYYINNNSTNISVYLNELFHPRTEGFEAQLHIVRMIYDHIVYLNVCRENLREQGQLTANLDACFLKWIGRYLKLYKNKLYDTLENTCSSYNNKVWLELKYLYYINYNNLCGDCFISINRNAEESKKLIKEKPFNVDEWTLLHKSMLKKYTEII